MWNQKYDMILLHNWIAEWHRKLYLLYCVRHTWAYAPLSLGHTITGYIFILLLANKNQSSIWKQTFHVFCSFELIYKRISTLLLLLLLFLDKFYIKICIAEFKFEAKYIVYACDWNDLHFCTDENLALDKNVTKASNQKIKFRTFIVRYNFNCL